MSGCSLVVAMTPDGVIGRDGGLPWRLREDLARFRRLTLDHAVIMGRRTFQSIGRPLPRRRNVVVSRSLEASAVEGAESAADAELVVVRDLDAAFRAAAAADRVFVIGGAEIYREAVERCDTLHVTWVDAEIEGDAHFPEIDWDEWTLRSELRLPADARNDHPTRYSVYERRAGAKPD